MLLLVLSFYSCHTKSVPEPKPTGYFRIELPDHEYISLDTALPFRFERSAHTRAEIEKKDGDITWLNIVYPDLNASFRFTCFQLKNADSLRKLMVSEDKMVKFHYKKAEDVQFSLVRDTKSNILGQTYEIYGKEVATPFQFWLTDSVCNFVRASLYFDGTPNNDSLQPVIDYLKEDGMHIISTFEWK